MTFELRRTPDSTAPRPERRSNPRQRMVLRVGLLEAPGRTSFCLVKNISAAGVQVKLYGQFESGCELSLTVGDETPLPGRVKWVHEQLAGIEFHAPLTPSCLLRVTQKLSQHRRRSSPRAYLAAHVLLTSNGRTAWGQLRDISTTGARIRTRKPIGRDSTVLLGVPGMPPLKGFVRWSDEDEIGVSFAAPIPVEIIAGWVGERELLSA
jgi:hypothetical protein